MYEIQKEDIRDILDDSIIRETLNLIKKLIEEDFEVNIESERELIDFINNPGLFLKDKSIIEKITELKEVIVGLGDFYYV